MPINYGNLIKFIKAVIEKPAVVSCGPVRMAPSSWN
jgi:hypothetical protein